MSGETVALDLEQVVTVQVSQHVVLGQKSVSRGKLEEVQPFETLPAGEGQQAMVAADE